MFIKVRNVAYNMDHVRWFGLSDNEILLSMHSSRQDNGMNMTLRYASDEEAETVYLMITNAIANGNKELIYAQPLSVREEHQHEYRDLRRA